MDTETEAFKELDGKRFNEVINSTRVYDSVLSRSQLMRSQNGLPQMITAFTPPGELHARLLTAYGVIGYDREERRRDIKKNWFD